MTTNSPAAGHSTIACHIISDAQMEAERERARNHFNANMAWRQEQHATHMGTQKGGGKKLRASRVITRPNGQTTTIIAEFAYEDGSREEFDGSQWRQTRAKD